jgi:hypothetical protein
MVGEMLGLGGGDVEALEVTVKEDEDSPSEPLDLLEARLQVEVDVRRTGTRYGRPERWSALRAALDKWAAEGQLV